MNRTLWLSVAGLALLAAMFAASWKEAHRPWREWQARYNAQGGAAPMPLQIRVLIPAQSGKPELCVTCHVGIEEISAAHPAQSFGCVVCHGGEPLALDKDRAHAAMRGGRNPSDLSVAAQSCGQPNCHGGYADEEQNHVDRVLKSIQATYAGGIAHVRFAFGEQETPGARLGVRAISDATRPLPAKALPALGGFAASAASSGAIDGKFLSCLSGGCHLWTTPRNPQPYASRGSGCAACHYVYAVDGLYRGRDATIPHDQSGHGITHRLTTAMPFSQCNHCHNRGNYSLQTMSFDLRDDLPPFGRPISAQVPPEGRRLVEYYQPIGQFTKCEYELDCVDCHTAQEAMGNGHIYGSKKDVRYVQCETCHGTLRAKPATAAIRDANELAMRRARMNGHADFIGVGDRVIQTAQGELLWNIKEVAPDKFVQIAKISGRLYPVPLVMGSKCRQDGRTPESDYCHKCHSAAR